VRADAQIDGDRDAHDKQAAEAKDDEPPNHSHNELGYQTLTHALRCSRAECTIYYFEVPFADLADS
jgi:hypothetical protein